MSIAYSSQRGGATTAIDRDRMRQAVELAQHAIGLSEPNPRVACIIGYDDGTILGKGYTQAAGSAHAEVMALRDAYSQGFSVKGATAWVTLEPCAHHGRTPPCCDALIEAGIAKCLVALQDPYPQVAGAGIARLRAAGAEVVLIDDPVLIAAARDINIGFLSRVERRRPWVRMKCAISLDGRAALTDGTSQWITGQAARDDGHRWRKRSGAILTGIGTILADNPRMDVRAVPTAMQPMRVVLDTHLRIPTKAAIFDAPGGVCVVAARGNAERAARLRANGQTVWDDWAENMTPTLAAVLTRLAENGVNELHVEAGPRLNGALLDADLVDELLIYQAPILVGPGRPFAETAAIQSLASARSFRLIETVVLDADLRIRLGRIDGAA